jgi:hypothetical protein
VASLPKLLAGAGDRKRFLTVLERLLADSRVPTAKANAQQRACCSEFAPFWASPRPRDRSRDRPRPVRVASA